GFLAALAHLAFELAARLSLHSARRLARVGGAHLRESDDHHAAGRVVARRGMDLCNLGSVARLLPDRASVVEWDSMDAAGALPPDDGVALDGAAPALQRGVPGMGFLPFAVLRDCLHGAAAPGGSRRDHPPECAGCNGGDCGAGRTVPTSALAQGAGI